MDDTASLQLQPLNDILKRVKEVDMRRSSRGNPYHDVRGRFASADSFAVKSELSKEEYDIRSESRFAVNEYKSQISNADSLEALNEIYDKLIDDDRLTYEQIFSLYKQTQLKNRDLTRRKLLVLVDGPKQTREFIEWYKEEHPEIIEEIPKYMSVLDDIKRFHSKYPDADNGTYDAVTGELVETSGYSVTFHQNYRLDDLYGGYSDEDYAAMCAITKKEVKSDSVYIGYYGNPEVSFVCQDRDLAMAFAVQHNQKSIYDSERDEEIYNKYYSSSTNPID